MNFLKRNSKEKTIKIVKGSIPVWGKYTDTYHKPALEEGVSLLKQSIKEVVNNAKITRREIKIIIE